MLFPLQHLDTRKRENPHTPRQEGQYEPSVPSWSDKLVGEVVRILLEAYYEPRFSGRSHGFRPGRGCHTALTEVAKTWKGTTWFIEGDISDCFGSLDHEVMLSVLAEHIHDNRFLRLIKGMLRAGYLEDWIWNAGSPYLTGVPPIRPLSSARPDPAGRRYVLQSPFHGECLSAGRSVIPAYRRMSR